MQAGPLILVCRTKHRLLLVSRRFNEALREPCEAWEHLNLHAKQLSKVGHLPRMQHLFSQQHFVPLSCLL